MEDKDKLEFTLSGRLRNLSLAPSASNSLVPLFEATTNSIHAIEDRFPESPTKGLIEIICLFDSEDKVSGFEIRDNGIGLNEKNYQSFRQADTDQKLARGGKGVGRLTWLKVFKNAHVESVYKAAEKSSKIIFDFLFDEDDPIQNKKRLENVAEPVGTSVRLEPFRENYLARVPRKDETVAREFVRHFLSYVISDASPQFKFHLKDGAIDIRDFYKRNIAREKKEIFQLELVDGSKVEIRFHHMLIDKSLRDVEKGTNLIFFCAHRRAVKRHPIDTQIGLDIINGNFIYVGIVESIVLDESVNQERTFFSIDEKDYESLKKSCVDLTKVFLKDEIAEIREKQKQEVGVLTKENPRFLSILDDPAEFVSTKLSLSQKSEEEIFLELTRQHRRELKRRTREFKKKEDSGTKNNIIDEKHRAYLEFVTKDTAHTLADYVVRRKAVLDALWEVFSYENIEEKKHYLEKAVHNYICPLGVNSNQLTYDHHNLWIIDDRLAYYNYFNSDKAIKITVEDSTSGREPDLSFFQAGHGFRREKTSDPVVIVEFKRPGREDYSKDNPVQQVLNYAQDIRAGKNARDSEGRLLSSFTSETHFIGYIIADITSGLKKALVGSIVNQQTSDGRGFYGYDGPTKTFIEIIPYDKLFESARTRNEVFFEKLGLHES